MPTDTDAAAAQFLTHICRSRPRLKLSLKACETRRAMADSNFCPGANKLNPYWECRGCEGAIPINQEANAVTEENAEGRPGACRDCGKTPDETPFYPSRKDRCKACIKDVKRTRPYSPVTSVPIKDPDTIPVNQAASQPEISDPAPIPRQEENPPMPIAVQAPIELSSSVTCICHKCGDHFEPYKNGAVIITKVCPSCMRNGISKKQLRNMRGQEIIALDFSCDHELLEELSASAKQERRTVDQQILVILERALLQTAKV